MTDQRNMTLGDVLAAYDEDCKVFELLVRFGYGRELAESLIVLWMWLKKEDPIPQVVLRYKLLPSGDLFRNHKEYPGITAYDLDSHVKLGVAALYQIRIGSCRSDLTATTPGSRIYFFANAQKAFLGMGALCDTGLPAVIFDDALRGEYLRRGPAGSSLLCVPFVTLVRGIAGLDDVLEKDRSLRFEYRSTFGRDFVNTIAHYFDLRFGDGYVERVDVDEHVDQLNPKMFDGRIVFRPPASFLQFAFFRHDGGKIRLTCGGGKPFHVRPKRYLSA